MLAWIVFIAETLVLLDAVSFTISEIGATSVVYIIQLSPRHSPELTVIIRRIGNNESSSRKLKNCHPFGSNAITCRISDLTPNSEYRMEFFMCPGGEWCTHLQNTTVTTLSSNAASFTISSIGATFVVYIIQLPRERLLDLSVTIRCIENNETISRRLRNGHAIAPNATTCRISDLFPNTLYEMKFYLCPHEEGCTFLTEQTIKTLPLHAASIFINDYGASFVACFIQLPSKFLPNISLEILSAETNETLYRNLKNCETIHDSLSSCRIKRLPFNSELKIGFRLCTNRRTCTNFHNTTVTTLPLKPSNVSFEEHFPNCAVLNWSSSVQSSANFSYRVACRSVHDRKVYKCTGFNNMTQYCTAHFPSNTRINCSIQSCGKSPMCSSPAKISFKTSFPNPPNLLKLKMISRQIILYLISNEVISGDYYLFTRFYTDSMSYTYNCAVSVSRNIICTNSIQHADTMFTIEVHLCDSKQCSQSELLRFSTSRLDIPYLVLDFSGISTIFLQFRKGIKQRSGVYIHAIKYGMKNEYVYSTKTFTTPRGYSFKMSGIQLMEEYTLSTYTKLSNRTVTAQYTISFTKVDKKAHPNNPICLR